MLEAHAVDDWPISSSRYHPQNKIVEVKQPVTMEERIRVAKHFQMFFGEMSATTISFYMDNMKNEFQDFYGSWPLRFYVFKNNELMYKAMPQNASYDICALEEFICANQ